MLCFFENDKLFMVGKSIVNMNTLRVFGYEKSVALWLLGCEVLLWFSCGPGRALHFHWCGF